jgi:hypothetical protein
VSHFRQWVVILLASSLSACGGGGGDSGGGGSNNGNPPLPDPGDSPPVVLYAGSSVGADLTAAVAPRMADHAVLLTLMARNLGARVGPRVFSTPSTGGTCYGSSRGTRNTDGTGWVETELNNCDSGQGLRWSGKIIHRVHTVAAGAPSDQSWTFPGATLHYDGATYTVSGRLRRLDTASSIEYSSNFTLRDDALGNVFGADELVWRSSASEETTLSVSGRLRDADVGYVDVSTELPLTLKVEERGFRPGGNVQLAGSASSVWFVPLTDQSVAVTLQRTGAAAASQSVLLNADARLEPQLATPGAALLGAAAGPAQTLEQGKSFRLQGLFTGAGSRRWMTLSWKIAMVPPGSLTASNQFSGPYPAFTPDGPGTYTFELTASDGVTTTHDRVTHKVMFADDDPIYYPPVSASSTGVYLGPDMPIEGAAIAVPPAITAFSTTAFVNTPVLFDYLVQDPSRRTVASAQVATGADFPSAGLGIPGFYFQGLGTSTDPGRDARRYFAHQQPLQYFRTAGFRVEHPGLGITAADLSGTGRKDIIVTGSMPLAGGGPWARGVFVIRNIEPGRYAAPEFIAGGNSGAITVGDFTGDGRPDIVLDAGGAIDLLAQLPGGAWAPAQRLHSAAMTTCPAVDDTSRARPLLQADFDGDGRPDVAYATVCGGGGVAVLFQNGDGTFTEHVIANVGADHQGQLLAADVSGDGRPDLIVIAGPPTTVSMAHVDVYASRADRTFDPAASQPVAFEPFTFAARSGAAGDYDGDGDTDILMSSSNGLFLFRQVAGALTQGYPVGSALRATWADQLATDFDFWIEEMCLIDIDGDGRLDVVERTIRDGVYPLSVLLQSPDGQLQAPRALFPADSFGGQSATLPVVIDENLDGFPDLLYVGSHERDNQSSGVTVVHQRPH